MVSRSLSAPSAPKRVATISIPPPTTGLVSSFRTGSGYRRGSEARGIAALAQAKTLDNVIPTAYGMRIRSGSFALADDLYDRDGSAGEVRTIMSLGSGSGGNSSIFGATNAGVYRIVGNNQPSVGELAFTNSFGDAGYCEFISYVGSSGVTYLLITDHVNGYFIRETDGTWRQGELRHNQADIGSSMKFIAEYRNRLWFAQANSTKLYYLDPLDMEGDVTEIDLGNRTPHGGTIKALAGVSYQDYGGLQDLLIIVTEGGDILLWSGEIDTEGPVGNPEPNKQTQPFFLVGRWYVGSMPRGSKIISEWGGNTVILTTSGVVRLKDLLKSSGDFDPASYATDAIRDVMQDHMLYTLGYRGWQVETHPAQSIAMIKAPILNTEDPDQWIQYVMNLNTGAWCTFRRIRAQSVHSDGTYLYFGTDQGQMLRYGGNVDDVPPGASPSDKDPPMALVKKAVGDGTAKPIAFRIQTHYGELFGDGSWVLARFLRAWWVANRPPSVSIEVRFDFEDAPALPIPSSTTKEGGAQTFESAFTLQDKAPLAELPEALWDTGVWDASLWNNTEDGGALPPPPGDFLPSYSSVGLVGLRGSGRNISIVMAGLAEYGGFLRAWELIVEKGRLP